MKNVLIRFVTGVIFGILSRCVMYLSKYGDVAELIGAVFSGLFLALSIYFLIGGSLEALKNNKDLKGKKYSWKNTISGIIIFIISIPVVILFTVYLYNK